MARSAGTNVATAASTGRLFFGPFERGRIVEGLHLVSFSNNAADTSITVEVRSFTEHPIDSAAAFADGFNELMTGNLALPLDVSAFFPLDILTDRNAWVGIQVNNAGAGTVTFSGGVESRGRIAGELLPIANVS